MISPDPRVNPPFVADERTTLTTWLDWHRATLAVKCADLSQDELRRRTVPPSGMSLLGLVRHMAHVERVWFRRILTGEQVPRLYKEADPDGDFNDVDTASAKESLATWRSEIDHARRISAALPLDAVGKEQRHGQDVSHRWILVHMIEEYARHNGHADLLRELLDGTTGT